MTRLLTVFGVLCAVLLIVDFFIDRTTHAPGESLPGFYAVYGFVGCVMLVLIAKAMRRVVMRSDDYYGDGDPPEGPLTGPQEGGH